jgi:hypothetical protein
VLYKFHSLFLSCGAAYSIYNKGNGIPPYTVLLENIDGITRAYTFEQNTFEGLRHLHEKLQALNTNRNIVLHFTSAEKDATGNFIKSVNIFSISHKTQRQYFSDITSGAFAPFTISYWIQNPTVVIPKLKFNISDYEKVTHLSGEYPKADTMRSNIPSSSFVPEYTENNISGYNYKFNVNFDIGIGFLNGSNASKALKPVVDDYYGKRKETNYFITFGINLLKYLDFMPFLGIGGGATYGTNFDNETNYWQIRNFTCDIKAVLRFPAESTSFEPYIAGGVGVVHMTIVSTAPVYTDDYGITAPYYLLEGGFNFIEGPLVLGFLVRHRIVSDSEYLNGYNFTPNYTEIVLRMGGTF